MDTNSLYKEREQNLLDATSFREPRKVPVGMEFTYWPFSYAGVTYKQVAHDPQLTAEKYIEFLDDISIDFVWGAAGLSNPYKAYQALGSESFYLADDDTTVAHAQTKDVYMEDDEYDEFIKNPYHFIWETLLRRKLPAFQKSKEEAYAALKQSMAEFKTFQRANDLIAEGLKKRAIYTLVNIPLVIDVPLKRIFDTVRGMKNTFIDLRRRPDQLKKACDKMFEADLAALPKVEDIAKIPGLKVGLTGYHVECFLSPQQFDEYYMSYFLKAALPYMEAGVKFFLKGEGRFIHTVDRFRQTPKGSMIIMLEDDDPFEVHKIVGDWCTIATGIKSSLLKYGTKQECIDYAKKCYDTFAPGGGFVFLQDRPLLSAQDAKVENVLAVYEFINEYGGN